MSSHLLETGLAALAFSRKVSLGLFEDIPDNKICHQPCAGANHPLWILGHLACTDEFFLKGVGGRPYNRFEKWEKLFFMGSKPTSDPKVYPPIAEVKEALDKNRQEMIGWFKSMSDAELLKPLESDLADFAANRAVLMSMIAWHEGLHAGQLSVVRKSLGLTPKFG
ncbi:MAG TPA: DinB family protein [Phycisphaerae bacterium]|nr:DinB family protein [Phycisphaerae bacterium]